MRKLTTAQVYVPNAEQLCAFVQTMTNLEASRIAMQVATAWHTMHTLGVAHLDAHGGNVLYDKANRHIVIIDFGFMHHLPDVHAFKQTFQPTKQPHNELLYAQEGQGSDTMHHMYGMHGYLPATRVQYRSIEAKRAAQMAETRTRAIRRIKLALSASTFALLFSVRTLCNL